MRFILDDGGLENWDDVSSDIEQSLRGLADLLMALRDQRKAVGILSGWGGLQATTEADLATTLMDRTKVERDLCLLVLGLLSKCEVWDEDAAIAVSDDSQLVDGNAYKSLAVAYAMTLILEGRGIAVVTPDHTGLRGQRAVASGSDSCVMTFIVQESDCKYFYRSLFALENVGEIGFFDLAEGAFPDLLLDDGLTFSRFEGGYGWRDVVVHHLGVLNDKFLDAYVTEYGNSARISTRIGIEVSIEGSARSSSRLMASRNIEYDGTIYRCEWHSKLEPHRNRIYFCPGSQDTGERTFIGVFSTHL